MGAIAESRRKNLWFGTEQHMEWFKTPSRGADTTPSGWDSEGTTLNGMGYSFNSFGSHKVYQFDWGSSASREVAQKMKSFADGTYGRGKIYFIDPTINLLNVLPARWADPTMTAGYEGYSLVNGVIPELMSASPSKNGYPANTVTYNLDSVTPGFRGEYESVFIPIPEGHILPLWASYSATGSGGVFVSPVSQGGATGAPLMVAETPSESDLVNAGVYGMNGEKGVRLWIGREDSSPSSVTLRGMTARVLSMNYSAAELSRAGDPHWIGGMGHEGCRFSGKPTMVLNGPDWTGFSATLREVTN